MYGKLTEGELRAVSKCIRLLLDGLALDSQHLVRGVPLTREGLALLKKTVDIQAMGAAGVFDKRTS